MKPIAQVNMRISEAYAVGGSGVIQWNESELRVSDRLKSTRMVTLKIYHGQDLSVNKIIGQSISIQVNSDEQVFLLRDLFSQPIIWSDSLSRTICFVLTDERTQQPLGRSCGVVRRQISNDRPHSSSKTNASLTIEGELQYELSNNYASIVPNDESGIYHIGTAQGNIRVKNIPFKFSGQYSNVEDPFLQHNLNQFTTFYDAQTVQMLLRRKAEKVLKNELEKKKDKHPELNKIQSRYSSISNLLSNPGAVSELKDLENIEKQLKDFDVADLNSLLVKSDSLTKKMSSLRSFQDTLLQLKTTLRSERRDSIMDRLDSCSQTILTLSKNLEDAAYLETLLQKRKGYEQILLLKDSCEQYLERTQEMLDAYQKNKDDILRNPANVRSLLEEHNLLSRKENLLSKISNAKIGILHPAYSSLSMQNIRHSGAELGYDNDTWSAEAFISNSLQQSISLNADSNNTNQSKLIGSQLGFSHGKSTKTSLFFVHAYRQSQISSDEPRSHMGLKNEVTFKPGKFLKSEMVWSGKYDNGNEKEPSSFSKSLKEMAMKLAYVENGKRINWKLACEYFGSNYKDFYNPFLRSNSINASFNGSMKVSKYASIGLNSVVDFGNLWSAETFQNSLMSFGGFAAIHNPKFPSVMYTNQITITQSGDYDFVSNWHMLSSSMTYQVKEQNWTSSLSSVYSNQTATLDSSAYSSFSLQYFQNIALSDKFQLELSGLGNFIEQNENDKKSESQAAISIFYTGSKIHGNIGTGWLNTSHKSTVGFELGLTCVIMKHLTGQLNWNNLRRPSSYLNGNQINVSSNFQMRINYKF